MYCFCSLCFAILQDFNQKYSLLNLVLDYGNLCLSAEIMAYV